MHAERVDGYNPLAVIDAIAPQEGDHRKRRRPGAAGHGDLPLQRPLALRRQSSYREKAEVEAWQKVDPLHVFAQDLVDAERLHPGRDRRRSTPQAEAVDPQGLQEGRRPEDLARAPTSRTTDCLLERTMFSNQKVESLEPAAQARGAASPRRRTRASSSWPSAAARPSTKRARKLPKSKCVGIRDAHLRGDPRPLLRRSRRWSPTARRTATGAAPSPSIAA